MGRRLHYCRLAAQPNTGAVGELQQLQRLRLPGAKPHHGTVRLSQARRQTPALAGDTPQRRSGAGEEV